MMRKIPIHTASKLAQIFWPDFIEIDGSIFLASENPGRTCVPEQGMDRTGMESLVNHIHMVDIFQHKADIRSVDDFLSVDHAHPDFELMCNLGKSMARMWFQKLKIDFPDYDFRVYYTREDDPIVRFHRVRNDEGNWLDEPIWQNEVKQGAIIIYDTRYEIESRNNI
jgi:hypothetical protein